MQTQQRPFPVSGKEGDEINPKLASQWTRNYRSMQPNETISHLFGNEIINQILKQEGCIGLRIYYANSLPVNGWQRLVLGFSNFLRKTVANGTGEKHVILVGVENSGKDQIPHGVLQQHTLVATGIQEPFRILAQQAIPCPGSAGCPENELTG